MQKRSHADVALIRQRTQFTCCAASIASALHALGKRYTEDDVNMILEAGPMRGASWEAMLATVQYFGCRGSLVVPSTPRMLKQWTDSGKPVVIAWNPESRPWSHASTVFKVTEDEGGKLWVHVMDPNIPNPGETVRVMDEDKFSALWAEKVSESLFMRRPAMVITEEVDLSGRQVMASTKTAGERFDCPRSWQHGRLNEKVIDIYDTNTEGHPIVGHITRNTKTNVWTVTQWLYGDPKNLKLLGKFSPPQDEPAEHNDREYQNLITGERIGLDLFRKKRVPKADAPSPLNLKNDPESTRLGQIEAVWFGNSATTQLFYIQNQNDNQTIGYIAWNTMRHVWEVTEDSRRSEKLLGSFTASDAITGVKLALKLFQEKRTKQATASAVPIPKPIQEPPKLWKKSLEERWAHLFVTIVDESRTDGGNDDVRLKMAVWDAGYQAGHVQATSPSHDYMVEGSRILGLMKHLGRLQEGVEEWTKGYTEGMKESMS